MSISRTASCYTAFLLYYLWLNKCHTDLSITLFCSIISLLSYQGWRKLYPLFKQTKITTSSGASKLNFKVSLLAFLLRREEEAEISSEIHTTKNGMQKNPPQLTLIKEQRCGKRKKSKLKYLKYTEWWLILPRLIQKDGFAPVILPLLLCLGLHLSRKTMATFLAD